GFLQVDANAGGIIDAFIGQPADSGASTATTSLHVGGGAITVTAAGSITATGTADSTSGGLLTIGDFNPRANASGAARAYVRDNVDIMAGTLTVQAGTSGAKLALA